MKTEWENQERISRGTHEMTRGTRMVPMNAMQNFHAGTLFKENHPKLL
jgi:hypothetical protein